VHQIGPRGRKLEKSVKSHMNLTFIRFVTLLVMVSKMEAVFCQIWCENQISYCRSKC